MRAAPRIEIQAINVYLCGNGEREQQRRYEKKQRWIIYHSDLEHSFGANWNRGGKCKRVFRWTMPRPGAYCSLFTFDSGERHFFSFILAGNLWPGVCLFVCNRMRFNSVQQQQTTATDRHRIIGAHTFDAFGPGSDTIKWKIAPVKPRNFEQTHGSFWLERNWSRILHQWYAIVLLGSIHLSQGFQVTQLITILSSMI